MKKKTVLNTTELPAIHRKLESMMANADYDLQTLKEMKQWPGKNIEADQMEAIIWACRDNDLPAYSVDPVTGQTEHKFSQAYYWPMHRAVRFRSHPDTTLVRISVKDAGAYFAELITSDTAVRELIPRFKTVDAALKGLQSAIDKSAIPGISSRIQASGCLLQHVMNAVSNNRIARRFLKAGMQSFIIIQDDMFLVLPENEIMAINIIKDVFKEMGVNAPVLEVEE